ncbi:hypothetical protein BK120_08405 [Paenibacillus sp. FSL A5-0031]|uniref:hypothetical protein n=1 Tax=Paenibacillus sp. FSL A5-0031 TaxID=1920420 RepID=UPI00096D71C4|nr:hypothetical protein [Paenibacillus sp. FSL A5-0031]OME86935.1 hypothetical protein BK120_08405 [Paenibacillus sp. FSL A5-0031]
MIVHADGGYEIGSWLTADTYPDSYFIEDETDLAAKILARYPYYTLDIVDGALIDVTPRDKTPEEEAAESAPAPKSPEQISIETLEAENTALQSRLADVELALIEIFGGVA